MGARPPRAPRNSTTVCRICGLNPQLCKFGKYICYNSRDIEFFPGVLFWRALYVKKKLKQTNASVHLVRSTVQVQDT